MKEFREKIDLIDEKILDLLIERFDLSIKIGSYKKINKLEIENLKREDEIAKSFPNLYKKNIENIYREIFKNSKHMQEKLFAYLDKNIVLIGMPGCGKTTLGEILSKKLKRDFFDTDKEFENLYGSPEEFIIREGLSKFRDIESEILRKFSKNKYGVISTGGGIVERKENLEILKDNSVIYYIDRDTDKLTLSGIQPSYKKDLYKLREKRENLYREFSDEIIKNNTDPQEAVGKLIESFNNDILVKARAGVL